jgi:hypothetical protein
MGPRTYRALEIMMWIAAGFAMALAVLGYMRR